MSDEVFAFDADGTLYTYHRTDADIWSGIMADSLIRAGVQKDRAALIEEDKVIWQMNPCAITYFSNAYGVNFELLLHSYHDALDVEKLVRVDGAVVDAINRLPGKKFMLTDSTESFASRVLAYMGLQNMQIIARDHHSGYPVKKTSDIPWRALQQRANAESNAITVFDDRIGNLERAKRLGMKTVLYSGEGRDISYADVYDAMKLPYVDYVSTNLANLLNDKMVGVPWTAIPPGYRGGGR